MQISSKINVSCCSQCCYYAIGPCFITNLTANSSLPQTTSQPFVGAYCCFAWALFNTLTPLVSFQTFHPDNGVNSLAQRVSAARLRVLPRQALLPPSAEDGTQRHGKICNPKVRTGSKR